MSPTSPEIMETPLLNGSLCGEDGDYLPPRGFKAVKSVFCTETKKLWKLAGPIVFNTICQYGMGSITNIFVGHLGEIPLSAVTISVGVIGTFTFGFLLGMGSALETLCGQAYGAGQVHMLGIYMQRSVIILTMASIILLPVYIFATPILKLLGQADEIAYPAGKFTLLIIPQMLSLAITFPTQKFLQAQSKVNFMAWVGLIALLSQALLLYLFMYVFGWGVSSAAVAYDITNWGIAIAQVIYIVGWCKEGWHGLSWAAFKDIWSFVRLSFASAVMLCLEVWYMMSIIILTGHLNNAPTAVGSLSICMNINGLEGIFFIGLTGAISVRVSNELGWGRPRAAKYAVYSTVFQAVIIGLLCMVVVLLTKDYFGIIFTNSKNLQRAVAKLAYLLGITMVLNSIQPVISGVAIGAGWQSLVAYINLGCYYVFGIPFGYLLGYVAHGGVMGIWGGMICGTGLQTFLLCCVLYKVNWTKEVEQTTERMRKWGGQDIVVTEQTTTDGV